MKRISFFGALFLTSIALYLFVDRNEIYTQLSAIRHHGFSTSGKKQSFTAWGDSFAAGSGSSLLRTYANTMRLVYWRTINNEGGQGETSEQVRMRFLKRPKSGAPERVIIWVGRNDLDRPTQVLSNVASMISDLTPNSQYLVLGITFADRPREHFGGEDSFNIAAINRGFADAYGERFVPVSEMLASSALPSERADVERGVTPKSFRSDDLHLNDDGQGFVATMLEAALRKHGW